MKLHIKLGIIFSVIVFIFVMVNLYFWISFERNSYFNLSRSTLAAVGSRMIDRFDDYMLQMDNALKILISNADFMEAMALQGYLNPEFEAYGESLLEARNISSAALWRNPLNHEYYRVSAFNRSGMFYSSRVESAEVSVLSDEQAAQVISAFEWINFADENPFAPVFFTPTPDPWQPDSDLRVFGLGRAIIWSGQPIGYLEVQQDSRQLAEIFEPEDLHAVQICAFINDMEPLYESTPGCLDAARLYMENGEAANSSFNYACVLRSGVSGLTLYISQDTSLWDASLRNEINRTLLITFVTAAFAMVVIWLASRQLTKSVRTLEKSILGISFEDQAISTHYSKLKKDDEIYVIQHAFDQLVDRLNTAIHNVMHLHELNISAQMNALQAQINPHFVYNTLNVIASKGLENGALEIVDLCERFSDMLRYSTDASDPITSLSKEINHATNYLELMKSRYMERFSYVVNLPDELRDVQLPKLVIQPLVENSIAHGYANNLRRIQIVICCAVCEGGFIIKIHDGGDGFSDDVLQEMQQFIEQLKVQKDQLFAFSSNMGMKNTFTRLYLHAKGKINIRMYNDYGAVIELTFLQ